MFEPEREEGEEEEVESEAEDDAEEEPGPEDWRIGNTNWCQCGVCVPMATPRESLCCREMGNKLGDKLADTGTVI